MEPTFVIAGDNCKNIITMKRKPQITNCKVCCVRKGGVKIRCRTGWYPKLKKNRKQKKKIKKIKKIKKKTK